MVAGGTESPDLPHRALPALPPAARCRPASTISPTKASRPYDKDRDGFVMGEGAGIVVLEELEHAKARGARIYAEVIGYGLSGDAYHITAPAEDGDGAYRCMRMALKRAGIAAERHRLRQRARHLDAMGDEIELAAVERLFGNAAGKLAMSSTKSADRAPARRRRRGRGDLLGARHPRQHRAADAQPRQPVGGDGDRSRAAQGARSARSTRCSPTRSASAAPTPRSCCAAWPHDPSSPALRLAPRPGRPRASPFAPKPLPSHRPFATFAAQASTENR